MEGDEKRIIADIKKVLRRICNPTKLYVVGLQILLSSFFVSDLLEYRTLKHKQKSEIKILK
jgi:hypothetical protein